MKEEVSDVKYGEKKMQVEYNGLEFDRFLMTLEGVWEIGSYSYEPDRVYVDFDDKEEFDSWCTYNEFDAYVVFDDEEE